jgi:hypothetical protein
MLQAHDKNNYGRALAGQAIARCGYLEATRGHLLKLLMALLNQDPLAAPLRWHLVECFSFDESSLAR